MFFELFVPIYFAVKIGVINPSHESAHFECGPKVIKPAFTRFVLKEWNGKEPGKAAL